MQTEEAKHQANKNTGSGESLSDKASHATNVVGNKVTFAIVLDCRCRAHKRRRRVVDHPLLSINLFVLAGSGDKAQCPERHREISTRIRE